MCSRHRRFLFPRNCRMEKGVPNTIVEIYNFGFFLTKCSPSLRALLTPRVSQNVDSQPLNVRENGQCLGPQAESLRCHQSRFFRVTQTDRIVPLKVTAKNALHGTLHRHRQHTFLPKCVTVHKSAGAHFFTSQNTILRPCGKWYETHCKRGGPL